MIDEEGKKPLWSYVKSKCKDVVGISSLKHDGQLISHNEKQANILNNQFSSVFTREDDGPLPSMGTSPFPDAPDSTVSPEGVRKLLQQLQPHKTMGPDQIPTKLLKVGRGAYSRHYTTVSGIHQSTHHFTGMEEGQRSTCLQEWRLKQTFC